ncbi:MAG TPA: hypothetical protein VG269_24390 [Tepidisphaeraceae bacterium]|nr:hypothetical protein [Tepidisphaeraceae bacterium]
MLDDKTPEVRARGAKLLSMSERDLPEVGEALWSGLSDESKEVRHFAADAIKTLRPPSDARPAQSIVKWEDHAEAPVNARGAWLPWWAGTSRKARTPRPAGAGAHGEQGWVGAVGALQELSRSDDVVFVKRPLSL